MFRACIACILLVTSTSLFSQTDKECRGNIDLNAVFEKIDLAPDTVAKKILSRDTIGKKDQGITPSGILCPAGNVGVYRLHVLNDAFTIISFTIIVENGEGDILEVVNQGDYLQAHSRIMIASRKKQEPIYLSCIKVMHTNGSIRVLKPLTINTTIL